MIGQPAAEGDSRLRVKMFLHSAIDLADSALTSEAPKSEFAFAQTAADKYNVACSCSGPKQSASRADLADYCETHEDFSAAGGVAARQWALELFGCAAQAR